MNDVMERFWNFLIYATWITFRDVSINLISNPINAIISIVYPKNRKKQFKKYQSYIKNTNKSELIPKKSSMNSHAFKFMLFSTSLFSGLLVIVVNNFLDFQLQNGALYSLFIIVVFSIGINYFFLYQNDKYLYYFESFTNQQKPINSYLIACIIHVLPLLILIFVV